MEQVRDQFDYTACLGSRRILPTDDRRSPIHRIAEVIKQEGVTLRTIARRLGTTLTDVRRQLDPTYDMSVSELYQWQSALSVPISELLIDAGDNLSSPVAQRTRLLKLMRTARSIQEECREDSIQLLAQQLSESLEDMMPELKDTSAWPSLGQPRSSSELGTIAYNIIPVKVLQTPPEDV